MLRQEDIQMILSEELTAMRERIIANMQRAGQVVTGQTADSITVDVYAPASARLTARDYFAALETGTQPWRHQYPKPPAWWVETIREWADAKGLTISAYLVARKIMREGSSLYRSGGRTDIFTNEILPTEEAISKRIGAMYTAAFRDIVDFGQYRKTFAR